MSPRFSIIIVHKIKESRSRILILGLTSTQLDGMNGSSLNPTHLAFFLQNMITLVGHCDTLDMITTQVFSRCWGFRNTGWHCHEIILNYWVRYCGHFRCICSLCLMTVELRPIAGSDYTTWVDTSYV